MKLDLQGRVAMVAAASKGIGKACALALAAEGCKVSLCARNADEWRIDSQHVLTVTTARTPRATGIPS